MRAAIRGLAPAPGAVRLLLTRALVMGGLSAGVFFAARGSLTGACGAGPCGPQPGILDFDGVTDLLGSGGSVAIALVAAAAVVFWIVDQVLMAAAIAVFDPRVDRSGGVKVFRALRTGAGTHLLPFLRIALVGALLAGLWVFAVSKGTAWIDDVAARGGWTALARVELVGTRVGLMSVGVAAVGTFTFWCKVLTVVDSRRRVRRTVLHALRLAWRRPLTGYGFVFALGWGSALLSAPATSLGAPWASSGLAWVGWLATVVVLFGVWHWRIHAAVQVLAEPPLEDVRSWSDEPFGVLRWPGAVWRWVRGRRPVTT